MCVCGALWSFSSEAESLWLVITVLIAHQSFAVYERFELMGRLNVARTSFGSPALPSSPPAALLLLEGWRASRLAGWR